MGKLDSILMVGCGNMGGAMLRGWLAAGADPARFTVVDPYLAGAPDGVGLLRELPPSHFDAVLLGVKPQGFAEVAAGLAPQVGPETLVLSILAGIELASLSAALPDAAGWVRIMPNLAAALGKSPMALAELGLDQAVRNEVNELLAPLGTPEWITEAQFDLATALVGSGPAFVYRFIDALAAGGAELGFSTAQAQRLALAMVEGAAELARESPHSPAELARMVASPGGTTEAGLKVLDADQALEKLVVATLRAARDRGAALAAFSAAPKES
ncbi:pyrroline-5-carboxylate reductase [Novosphingobium ginsenosidimutans]|uniref:Pyrroline-5-carboxylate reductase n=1 Tax=Novosphingobium ginsenosidimutans TaxID=1176536 RepID=A0A5B8S213_9SPHN|nr:pyrroline-5-carboxylate reductase [Novosphingobium ginsenosidimutans]QEA14875.1 pyrroline-5-carboxylate reductase [Novosphingobium ginsenosidimutans]